jgi:hypothetical protein
MASILKVDTLTGVTTAGSISVTGEGNSTTTNLQQGLCKAWLNIDQTSTQAIRDSFGISSIADSGTGLTTVTVSNAFANNDYLANIALRMQSTVSNTGSSGGVDTSDGSTTITTTAHRLSYINTGSTGDADTPYGGSSIHGDLA